MGKVTVIIEKQPWPSSLKDQVTAVRQILSGMETAVGPEAVASAFKGRRTAKRLNQINEILETLVALGQAGEKNEKYIAG